MLEDLRMVLIEDKWWDDYYFWRNYPRLAYKKMWNSINETCGYGWDTNPWVWVIEFNRV